MLKKKRVSLVLAILLIVSALNVFTFQTTCFAASSIYVSPTGNDTSGDGSISNPYQSLNKASSVATAGSTIYMRGGTYAPTNMIVLTCAGTSNSPITITKYPGEQPVIDAANMSFSNWWTEGAILINSTAQYIVIDGIELKNSQAHAIHLISSSNITIQNCKVHDCFLNAISLQGNNCLVQNNEFYNICLRNLNGIGNGSFGWPQVICTMYVPAVAPATVGTFATNNIFRGNYLHDNWGESIDAIASMGTIIENNTIIDGYSCGIYLDGSQNGIIRNNYIASTSDAHNRADMGMPFGGIGFGNENETQWGFPDYPYQPTNNMQIYNNICRRVGIGFQWFKAPDNPSGLNYYSNLKVYNNAFDLYDRNWGVPFIMDTPTDGIPTGNEFKNNICWGGSFIVTSGTWTFANNCWVNGIPSNAQDPNSIAGNPNFVNPVASAGADGYKLNTGSSCANTGATIAAVTTDYFGNARSIPYSIGANEYGSSSPTTTPTPTPTLTPTPTPTPTTTPTTTPTPTPTPTPGGNNLIGNPGFESGSLSPWNNWGGLSMSTSDFHSGTYACKVYSSGGGMVSVPANPGESYTVSVWGKNIDDSNGVLIYYLCLDSRGVDIPGSKVSIGNFTSGGGYMQKTATFTTPPGTAYVGVMAWGMGGHTYYFDDLSLIKN